MPFFLKLAKKRENFITSIIDLTIQRPKPLLVSFAVGFTDNRLYGTNIFFKSGSGMPSPSSVTSNSIWSFKRFKETRTTVPGCENLTALLEKL